MDAATDRAVDKIKKLLALANDSRGNEQERDTALRQAHALLVKHNLDMADVENKSQANQDPRIDNVEVLQPRKVSSIGEPAAEELRDFRGALARERRRETPRPQRG